MTEKDPYDLLVQGRRLMAERHHHQAAIVLKQAIDLEPGKVSIHEDLARALFNSGQIRASLTEFERALELDPADDYAYFGAGLCRARLGETRSAIGSLKIAVAMRPELEEYRQALHRLAG